MKSVATPRQMRRIYALEDLEPAASRYLPRPIFGYVEGGAETNWARADNRAAFDEIGLLPRTLIDVSGRQLTCTLMDRSWDLPFGIAPMGVCALTGYRGDIALAAAAREAGIPMSLSGASLTAMEEVAEVNPDIWFQAYLPGDMDSILALVERVARAGIDTLVITVDTAVLPSRENNRRTGYRTPLRPSLSLLMDGLTHPQWAVGTFLRTLLAHGMPHFENATAERGAPLLSRRAERDFSGREYLDWTMMAQIRRAWAGKLVIKGLLHPDDVRLARKLGAEGVILSNHGGRQLDFAISPMRVLQEVKQFSGDMAVMLDGGIRRGTDILKAFGLGADFVFIGRPMNYAAALAGQAGVAHVIGLMETQLRADLGMLGLVSMDAMGTDRMMLDRFAVRKPEVGNFAQGGPAPGPGDGISPD